MLGKNTSYELVKADDHDPRSWLADAPLCGELKRHSITHCGVMHAVPPMEIARVEPSGSYFMAGIEGTGEILMDSVWKTLPSGFAGLQPPFLANSLRTRRRRWTFCWVRYRDDRSRDPIAGLHSPALAEFDPLPLMHAINGLVAECEHRRSASAMRRWTDLVHFYVTEFAAPFRRQDRLYQVWELVATDLATAWSLSRIAEAASMSKEHLRRLTQRTLGRSPGQHLMHLRMRHAANLLATTEHSLTTIAELVGFSTSFSFSNTFLRWTGLRPSAYRQQYQSPNT
jgi:AraC-like DNA-binding protein